jgi:hypothetical protein
MNVLLSIKQKFSDLTIVSSNQTKTINQFLIVFNLHCDFLSKFYSINQSNTAHATVVEGIHTAIISSIPQAFLPRFIAKYPLLPQVFP